MQPNKQALDFNPQQYQAAHLALVANSNSAKMAEFELQKMLSSLTPHSLSEQNQTALMDRVDTKYLLPMWALPGLLKSLKNDYSILSQQEKRIFSYETTYFDTQKKHFFNDHHNGKLNRVKVRFRRYVEADMGFMEVKLKNNKFRTIKKRIPMNRQGNNQMLMNGFIHECIGEDYSVLQTALLVNYRRLTLLNPVRGERLTMDLDVTFQCSETQKKANLGDVFIVEAKREGKMQDSSFSAFLKEHAIRQVNFSKYCMGLVLTQEGTLKTNRFKSSLLALQKVSLQQNALS